MSKRFVADLESNDYEDVADRIWCLAYCNTADGKVCSTTYIDQIRDFFLDEEATVILHNGVLFDVKMIERLLNIKVKCKIWDSLAISWVLYPDRKSHSLESWGDELSLVKIPIDDWKTLPISRYVERCERDVEINYALWKKMGQYLTQIYEGNHETIIKYLNHLTFKLECVRMHKETGVELDIDLCQKSLAEFETIKEDKIIKLKEGMPKKANKEYRFPPKVMFKADGTPSANRIKWLKFLEEQGKPLDWNEEVEYVKDYEEPNPGSQVQLKEWLFSLGWEPIHFDYKNQEGSKEKRKVPQIKEKNNEEGALCPSVKKLIEKSPVIEELDSLAILNHRINLFKGFLRDQKNGRLYQGVHNYTNTLRLSHSGIVNLPKPFKKYAENVRKCLKAGEGQLIVGCDLKGIEDNTKRHYIFKYDPEYVKEQMVPGWDSHLDIAIQAKMLTKEQADNHKNKIEDYSDVRAKSKNVNFSATYGASASTINLKYGLPLKEAEKLLKVYWERNWAIKKIAENCRVKVVQGQKWLYNEVSEFWYTLRAEKDRFSTLNQGTAAYCFDRLMYHTVKQGLKINWEMHDEQNMVIYEETLESVKNKIEIAVKDLNEEIKLNVPIEVSLEIGHNYAEAH